MSFVTDSNGIQTSNGDITGDAGNAINANFTVLSSFITSITLIVSNNASAHQSVFNSNWENNHPIDRTYIGYQMYFDYGASPAWGVQYYDLTSGVGSLFNQNLDGSASFGNVYGTLIQWDSNGFIQAGAISVNNGSVFSGGVSITVPTSYLTIDGGGDQNLAIDGEGNITANSFVLDSGEGIDAEGNSTINSLSVPSWGQLIDTSGNADFSSLSINTVTQIDGSGQYYFPGQSYPVITATGLNYFSESALTDAAGDFGAQLYTPSAHLLADGHLVYVEDFDTSGGPPQTSGPTYPITFDSNLGHFFGWNGSDWVQLDN